MSNRVRRRGLLVPAASVARELGLDARTVRRWIERGDLSGVCLRGSRGRRRWYAYRRAYEAMVARIEAGVASPGA